MRSCDRIPIIVLSAKSSVSDKVLGSSVGAEDYISNPFEALELKARVESRLRRRDREKREADTLRLRDIEIDRSRQTVAVVKNGESSDVDLTPIEFRLLLYLAKEPNHVISRNEVLNDVWGVQVYVHQRSVDTHISKLRRKLGSVLTTSNRYTAPNINSLRELRRLRLTFF